MPRHRQDRLGRSRERRVRSPLNGHTAAYERPSDRKRPRTPGGCRTPDLTAHEGLVADYNIAAWLHLPDACDLLVSLVVSYLDGGRQREVAVDHGRIDRQQRILLSGIARLPVRQKVENMQVRLKSATAFSRLVVEEFFVQAVEQENRSQQVSEA